MIHLTKINIKMNIFTFPIQSIYTMSDANLIKILKYFGITNSINRNDMINSIEKMNKNQHNFMMMHRIDIGYGYINHHYLYRSFKIMSRSRGEIETYLLDGGNLQYKLTYDNSTKEWKTVKLDNNMECNIGMIAYYDDFRKAILFMEDYKHTFSMIHYLVDNKVLLKDIASYMLHIYPKSHQII